MRQVESPQIQFGETIISQIEFDPKSRDDIPQLLMGLQHIYTTESTKIEIFRILEAMVPPQVDPTNGRPGMMLWKILVMGTLRLSLNWDYDRLHEMVNQHRDIRQMLGHGLFDQDYKYSLQTLKDNVHLLTPEILDKIDQVVIKAGHTLVKKKDDILKGKCDSFVVKTNVHYPTDINLLFDAMRKVITLLSTLLALYGVSGWRQNSYNIKKVKQLFRKAQKLKHSTSDNPKKKKEREAIIIEAYQAYLDLVDLYLKRAKMAIEILRESYFVTEGQLSKINGYIVHAERQIDQVHRRVIEDETIPHDEKVFSIFEEHTEWICKGKAGVSQELGLRVCILDDQYGFILHHQVMEKKTDDQVPVSMVEETQEKFDNFSICSFDKGFHSPSNQEKLRDLLDLSVLPKKGKLSQKDRERQYSEEFVKYRRQHSAVESAINALEVHGLDMCPDHGIDGFKRYVALAVLARNIQTLGVHVKKRKLQSRKL